jgi:O-antigen/teichoic acid export membrane protein
MSAPTFWEAHRIVPVIVLAYLLQAWTQFGNFGLLYAERTRQLALATVLAALAMALACVWLVPRHGAMGAAFATLFAFGVRFGLVWFTAQRHYRMRLPWLRVNLALLLAMGAWLVASTLRSEELFESMLMNSFWLLAFSCAVVFSPLLGVTERRALRGLVDRHRRRLPIASGLAG